MCHAKESLPEVNVIYVYPVTWGTTAKEYVQLVGMDRTVAWNAVTTVWIMIPVFM